MNTIISQAMATGLPVITTRHSGLPEQVLDGRNGAVVPEGDPKALAEGILFLMEHPELWPQFGRFGRAHAAENYDSKRLIRKQVELYTRLLSERNKTSMEQSIERIWDRHWASSAGGITSPLRDRFTIDAFRAISGFVNGRDTSILEAGCGTGRFCALFASTMPQCAVTGIDISPSALDIARQLKSALRCENLTFQQADLFKLPFPDGQFDFVFNEGVVQVFSCENDRSYANALREMTRVTKAGGKVLVSVVNWHCYPHTVYKWLLKRRKVSYEYGYEKSFTGNELVRLFHEHGLRNVEFSGYYPSYGFHRLGNRLGGISSTLFHAVGALIDRFDRGWISRHFGFEIIVKGEK